MVTLKLPTISPNARQLLIGGNPNLQLVLDMWRENLVMKEFIADNHDDAEEEHF